jgi:hypothetical protein
MANIVISELRPAGSEFFMDSESYMHALTDDEILETQGGATITFSSMWCIRGAIAVTRSSVPCAEGAVIVVTAITSEGDKRGWW